MFYEIRDDRLLVGGTAVDYRPARDVGGRIKPTLIVLHDTAGGLSAEGSISWLAGNPNKTSAHFVIARDGSITQLASPDRKCNHAGQSSWNGREFVNGFGVGIEIVNPGKLLERGTGAVADFGAVYDRAQYGIVRSDSAEHGGSGWWMPYTPQQIDAVAALVEALGRAYPTITEVVGHHHISPRRKVDPTPLMPWDVMRAALARAREVVRPATASLPPAVDVTAVQGRLTELGYYTGVVDGVMGSRTEAAVFAMQRENGLAANGRLDTATMATLSGGNAKPAPTGHREEATTQSLAAQGSQTMTSALADAKDGKMQAAIAAITGILVAVKSLIAEAGVEIVIVMCLCAAAYYGIRQWRRGDGLAAHRLQEHKEGVK